MSTRPTAARPRRTRTLPLPAHGAAQRTRAACGPCQGMENARDTLSTTASFARARFPHPLDGASAAHRPHRHFRRYSRTRDHE